MAKRWNCLAYAYFNTTRWEECAWMSDAYYSAMMDVRLVSFAAVCLAVDYGVDLGGVGPQIVDWVKRSDC